MDITIVGCGHVGLVAAAAFAKLGHRVVGLDDDKTRVEGLRNGVMPIYEPGLDDMIAQGVADGRIRWTTDLAEGVAHGQAIFICVGTPPRATGEANLVYVERVAEGIARHAPRGYRLVVEKSTVPIMTGQRIATVLARNAAYGAHLDVASNPEFLREGTAIEDFLKPDRVVVGVSSRRAEALLRELYAPMIAETGCPFIVTDIGTSELIKHACNAFLATKLSFINAISQICERTGADVEAVSYAMGCDTRIGGSYLHAGAGYGGACLPKDVDAFLRLSREVGYDFRLLDEVARINADQGHTIVEKVRNELWNLDGKRIAVLGLAFKPDTDDTRNAPAAGVVRELVASGAKVRVYDPAVTAEECEGLPEGVENCADAYEALAGAHCAVVMTEWTQFREMDLARAGELMQHPIVVDGRNVFSAAEMARLGFTYVPVGRPSARPASSFDEELEIRAEA